MAELMPALLIGHGNPMNAHAGEPLHAAVAAIGATLPMPKATFSVGPLVHRRRGRHCEHSAEDDPRFRGLSARAIASV